MPVSGLYLPCSRAPRPCSYFSYRPRLPSLQLVVNAAATSRREAISVRPAGPRLSILSTLGFAVRNKPEQELARQTAEQAAQNDLKEELELAQKAAQPPPDLRPFLHPVGAMEARYVRMLSALCTHTYFLPKITAINLNRRHNLKLVTTSLACDISLREARHSADEVLADSDAMAADPRVVELLARSSPPPPQERHRQQQQQSQAPSAMLVSSQGGRTGGGNGGVGQRRPPSPQRAQVLQAVSEGSGVAPTAADAVGLVALDGETGAAAPGASPTDVVANSLAAAAGAAAAAAANVYSAAASAAAAIPATAASAAAPLTNNIVAFSRAATWSLSPVRLLAEQLQVAATAGHSTAAATVAAVSAALESARTKDRPKGCQSPTEWFVCDDEATHTRYFVLQGSDNLDHWRVNLTFDPVVFEDEALGVKVHRGFYECAQALYDRFLPMVQDHLATSPFARFAFTGHSLGGSLATLLMLMFVRRGVLPASCLAPTYTFGSPAILCEGAAGCSCSCAGAGDGGSSCDLGGGGGEAAAGCGGTASSGSSSGGLLARLGLPQGAVRNVMMHKDIVPRAFACDYSLLASLLRRVSGSFRDHNCLQGERQAMFHSVGQVLVLQPDEHLTFVGGEGYHPMLPPGPGLYLLRQPSLLQAMKSDVARMGRALQECADAITAGAPDAAPAGLEPASAQHSSDSSCVIGSKAKPGLGPVPLTAADALFALHNNPHPLDILGNSAAYGPNGQISRYHNPDNYCKALGAVLRARGATWQRLVSHASRTGLRWNAAMLEPAPGASQMLAIRGRLGAGGGKLSAVRAKPAVPKEAEQVAAGLETC